MVYCFFITDFHFGWKEKTVTLNSKIVKTFSLYLLFNMHITPSHSCGNKVGWWAWNPIHRGEPPQEPNPTLSLTGFVYKCTWLRLTPCDPMDFSPPGSFVHEILQARILEWVAISSSRGSSQPRDQTHFSCVSCIGKQILYHQHHLGIQLVILLNIKLSHHVSLLGLP